MKDIRFIKIKKANEEYFVKPLSFVKYIKATAFCRGFFLLCIYFLLCFFGNYKFNKWAYVLFIKAF